VTHYSDFCLSVCTTTTFTGFTGLNSLGLVGVCVVEQNRNYPSNNAEIRRHCNPRSAHCQCPAQCPPPPTELNQPARLNEIPCTGNTLSMYLLHLHAARNAQSLSLSLAESAAKAVATPADIFRLLLERVFSPTLRLS
jgi:hypothetical protein